MDIRPRTAGEILDDAWRLVLADAPPLYALCLLFWAPAAIVLLLLLTTPTPATFAEESLLPALFAVLLPLTGLASGAIQCWLRRRAEGKVPSLFSSLAEAGRRGLDHAAVRCVVILASLLGSVFLIMPGVAVWVAAATAHTHLASGLDTWTQALGHAGRQSQRHLGKATVVALARVGMVLLAVLNVHGVIQVVLWTGDQMAGLDLAVAEIVLTLANPVYDLVLFLLAGLLLAPYAEACNYLLYVDARARFEGLDLWYRVRRVFAGSEKGVGVG